MIPTEMLFWEQETGMLFQKLYVRKNASNSIASGWYPIAAHQIDLTLLPGEEKEFVFMLGYCEKSGR